MYPVQPGNDPSSVDRSTPAKQPRKVDAVLTVRAVISVYCAAIVILVGVIVFSITYTSSLSTVDMLGTLYAQSIATGNQVEVENYFDNVAADKHGLERKALMHNYSLPNEDPTNWTVLEKQNSDLMMLGLAYVQEYAFTTIIYAEGSLISYHRTPTYISETLSNAKTITNTTSGCCTMVRQNYYTYPTMARLPAQGATIDPVDKRFPAYWFFVNFINTTVPAGVWTGIAYSESNFLSMGSASLLYNSTGTYLGMLLFGVRITILNSFLKRINTTAGAQTFIIDSSNAIVASTHSALGYTVSWTANRSQVNPPQCSSDASNAPNFYTNFTIVCRDLATQSAFAPLRDLDASWTMATAQRTEKKKLDGRDWYVVGMPLRNDMAGFGLHLVTLMPESDVIGDIDTKRNITIAIFIVVLVLAVALSLVIVYLILRPLAELSEHMRGGRGEAYEKVSMLREIQDVQVAYQDLGENERPASQQANVELVALPSLEPRRGTAVFCEVDGLAAMWRVAPSDAGAAARFLAAFVKEAHTVLQQHGGTADKYVGDAVVAAWSGPQCEARAMVAAVVAARAASVDPLADAAARVPAAAPNRALRVVCGVATGTLCTGTAQGSRVVAGGAVVSAGRLGAACGKLGTAVLTDESTAAGLQGAFDLVSVGAIRDEVASAELIAVLGITADARALEQAQQRLAGGADSAAAFLRSATGLSPRPPVTVKAVLDATNAFAAGVSTFRSGDFAKAEVQLLPLLQSVDAPTRGVSLVISLAREQNERPSASFDGTLF